MKERIKPEELKSLQAPIKEKYRALPSAALVTLQAEGRIGEGLTCKLETGRALVEAGLHPATGGDGLSACSGDMLLVSNVVAELCVGKKFRFQDIGELALKGFDSPVHAHAVVWSDETEL